MKRITTVFFVLGLGLTARAEASDISIEIKEQAVNALVSQLGPISGKTPTITIWLDLLVTKIKIAEGPVHWNLNNISVDFSPNHIDVHGTVDATYDGMNLNGSIASANATVHYDQAKRTVRVSVSQVSVPFSVDTFFGTVTHTTTVNPGVSVEYPLGVARLRRFNKNGGLVSSFIGAATMVPSVQQDKLVLQGETVSW